MGYKTPLLCVLLCLAFLLAQPAATAAAQGYYYSHPFWGYGPYWGPSYPYYYVDPRGKIDIDKARKTDKVYVDGAFLGTIEDVDDFRLDPGNYNIRIVRDGRDILNQDFYVVGGKTIEITIKQP